MNCSYGQIIHRHLDIKDIYALTLNLLPARYIQYGSIEMSEKVPDTDIVRAIAKAIDRVREQPKQ